MPLRVRFTIKKMDTGKCVLICI